MFDTYHTRNNTEYVPYNKTVHQHNAPTIESVRLLREMEEAALKKIIDNIQPKDNIFNFTATVFHNPHSFTGYIIVKYSINGSMDTCRIEMPSKHETHCNKEELFRLIYKRLSEKLAENILTKMYRDGEFDQQRELK